MKNLFNWFQDDEMLDEAPKMGAAERYEAEQRAQERKERVRKVLGLSVVVVAVIGYVAFANFNNKSNAIKQSAKQEISTKIETEVKSNKEVAKSTSKEVSVPKPDSDLSDKPTLNPKKNPDPSPSPSPKPDPNLDPKPNPEPMPPQHDYDDFRDDPMYQGHADTGGGRSIESYKNDVLYAEAELLNAQIKLFEAEHPDMTDEEYEEYGRMVGEYGEKVAEFFGISNTMSGPMSPNPEPSDPTPGEYRSKDPMEDPTNGGF